MKCFSVIKGLYTWMHSKEIQHFSIQIVAFGELGPNQLVTTKLELLAR